MPIYEYQCQQCGHQLEALQKISDDPLKECPQCRQAELQKLVSAASFRLKGGGWYETDFKSGDKKHLADSDSGDKAGSKTDAARKGSKDKEGDSKASPRAGKSENSSSGDSKSTGKDKSGKKSGKASEH